MRYVAAYLLAVLAGNQTPDAAALERILSSVGVKYDATLANKVVSELNGKSLEQLLKDGSAKLASVPSGGAVAAAAPAASGAPAAKEESKIFRFFY
jgi:large subunit ribosomal protein LP2